MDENEKNLFEEVKNRITDADMVLIGIGDQMSGEKMGREHALEAYRALQALIRGKTWFAVTLNTDDLIYEAGLNRMFIVAPCGSEAEGNVITNEDYDESGYLPQWQFYMNWLTATLGKKLCILELGVGMVYPSVIRMPFERTVLVNQRSGLIRIHSKLAQVPEEIVDRSLCISEMPADFLIKIAKKD